MALVKVTNRVVIKRSFTKQIMAQIKSLNGSFTKVGFPQGGKLGPATVLRPGQKPHSKTMSEVSTIATKLEFGLGEFLERSGKKWPFMTIAFTNGVDFLKRESIIQARLVTSGLITAKASMALLGNIHEKQIANVIKTIRTPALSAFTIKKKGHDKPLIETHQLLNSVDHVEGKR